jgi:diaminopimelate decarboxylase
MSVPPLKRSYSYYNIGGGLGVPYSRNDSHNDLVARKLKPETQEFENSKNLEYHFQNSTLFMLLI